MAKQTKADKARRDAINKTVDSLDEWAVYLVLVKYRGTNPEHEAILFKGFHNGAYTRVVSDSGQPTEWPGYSLKVIKKLHTWKRHESS